MRAVEWAPHLIDLVGIAILKRAKLHAQHWPVFLGTVKPEAELLAKSDDVIDFAKLNSKLGSQTCQKLFCLRDR